MNTIDCILTRTSVRKFTEKPVPEDAIQTILRAGMSGPSAVNARPWSFVVVTDRETLLKIAEGNGKHANPLRGAAFGILVTGDLSRAYRDYWVIDCAIACQNMILAAHELGIGSVWLGTWPQENKIEAQKELFQLPEDQIPHSVIAFGYPAETPPVRPDYEENRVHRERW